MVSPSRSEGGNVEEMTHCELPLAGWLVIDPGGCLQDRFAGPNRRQLQATIDGHSFVRNLGRKRLNSSDLRGGSSLQINPRRSIEKIDIADSPALYYLLGAT